MASAASMRLLGEGPRAAARQYAGLLAVSAAEHPH